jgi:hypothetical protein
MANSGTQFDPAVVAAVPEVLERPSPSPAVPPPDIQATPVPMLAGPPRAHTLPR